MRSLLQILIHMHRSGRGNTADVDDAAMRIHVRHCLLTQRHNTARSVARFATQSA